MVKDMMKKSVVVAIVVSLLMAFASCSSNDENKILDPSLFIVGQWVGEFDVSQMLYEELSEEVGFDISPEPVYSNVYIVFNEDGTCYMELDTDSFAEAVGKCVEPYVSAIIGFDTNYMVDMIMQQVVSEMESDSFVENGYYELNNETGEVVVESEDGSLTTMYFNKDFSLEYFEEELDQTIIFEKS